MLGMGREDSSASVPCLQRKDHFIKSVTENWRYYFVISPSPESFVKFSIEENGGRSRRFICSKLRENLLEMEVRTFVRIQRVIWDHLLAFKGEIIQKQALFTVLTMIYRVVMLYVLFFLSFSFPARRGHFFI